MIFTNLSIMRMFDAFMLHDNTLNPYFRGVQDHKIIDCQCFLSDQM